MSSYDYLIVGAGSAGCVLAYRLSEDPSIRVLLVEAGGRDAHPYIHMPMGIAKLLSNDRITTTYQAIATDDGQREPWQRGRVLGGTSSVNGMVYTRCQPEDYGDWVEAGATGWGWDTMVGAFRAIEDHAIGAGDTRGTGGPLHVSEAPRRTPLSERLIAAAGEMGIPYRRDLNGADQHGIGYFIRTIRGGRRWSAAQAFLRPAMRRPNLKVRTAARAERLLFEGRRATGVEISDAKGRRERLHARNVIVSAGTVESPKLLQLSGIGPATELRRHGIGVLADRAGVGRNLREHRMFTLQYALREAGLWRARDYQGPRLLMNVLRYAATRSGTMATLAYDIGAFVKTDPSLPRPDAELVFAPYSFDMSGSSAITGVVRFEQSPGMQVVGCPLRPTSQGRIGLAAADAATPPVIEPNYLATEEDIATSRATVRFTRAMLAHPSLASAIGAETVPGADVESAAEIEEFVRRRGHCGLHAVGTCRMGADDEAVVDPALRVRGVDGLRVVDCSVMPTMVSGHTNAPVMALAWRAADIILAERRRLRAA